MGIIDFHIHVGKRSQLTPSLIHYLEKTMGPETLAFMDRLEPRGVAELLKGHGVSRAVLLAEYSPKTTGVVSNEFTSDFCKDEEMLIPFCSVDMDSEVPAGAQVERCLREMGCKGIKLLPSYSYFYPDDPRILSAYEVAQDLGAPVMFHTGTSLFPGSRIKYAHPLLLDDIAQDFPRLNIVMCHAGRPFWYKEAQWMLSRHSNVHIDTSGIPLSQFPGLFPKTEMFRDRFIFGSDWPTMPLISHMIGQVRDFPFSPETIEAILCGNASRLLGLE